MHFTPLSSAHWCNFIRLWLVRRKKLRKILLFCLKWFSLHIIGLNFTMVRSDFFQKLAFPFTNHFRARIMWECTLGSQIKVPVCLLIFEDFSYQYALIPASTFIYLSNYSPLQWNSTFPVFAKSTITLIKFRIKKWSIIHLKDLKVSIGL